VRNRRCLSAFDGLSAAAHYDQISRRTRDHDLLRGHALVTGLMNFVVPLQIGARDVAFPFLNNFSFWMTTFGAGLVMMSLFVASSRALVGSRIAAVRNRVQSGRGRRLHICPCRSREWAPCCRASTSIATIVKMRAPGMTLMKMPVFTWTALCTNVLIVAAFPVLTRCSRSSRWIATSGRILHE